MELPYFHWHTPRPRGIMIEAGHRKNNLPAGTFDCKTYGELCVCACGKKYVFIKELNSMAELEPSPQLDQYDRAGSN